MKRKKWLLGLCVICILLFSTIVVYAAIQARITVKNVIVVGDIKLVLHEQDESGKEVANKDVIVSRGYSVDRLVFAENTGQQPAFVRISVESIFRDGETGLETETDKISLVFNEDTRWIYKDGWYYYTEVLEPGERTVPLLSGVQFGTSLDESNQNDVLELKIVMHGLQAKNNKEDVLQTDGWPEE